MNISLRTLPTWLQKHFEHEFMNIKHSEHEFKKRFTFKSSKSISRDISSPPRLTLLAFQNLSNHIRKVEEQRPDFKSESKIDELAISQRIYRFNVSQIVRMFFK